jgi:DNA mismatch repair protein MutH
VSCDFVPVPSVPSGESILIIDMTFVCYSQLSEDAGLSWENECVFVEVAVL